MEGNELDFKVEHLEDLSNIKKFKLVISIRNKDLFLNYNLADFERQENLLYYLNKLKSKLDKLIEEVEKIEEPKELKENITSEQLWAKISKMKDEEVISLFNSLQDQKRRELADFVFSHCNVFSGKGRLFSERYDSETNTLK